MGSLKFSFDNSRGQKLAGIIEMPEGTPRFYGVFAPCFTCVKETHGAMKISRALSARGVAMLRFDTAGVGGSEGILAETNFTTRIDDIISACRAVEASYAAPRLLVGHSISGPASISAVKNLPAVEVVATVGSPKDPQAMIERFTALNQLTVNGDMIEIDVLGRKTAFKKSFVDDLLAQTVAADTAVFNRTLLSFHAPNDSIVGFDNAQAIYDRAVKAKHREVIRMNDDATHLFEKHNNDADFIAEKLLQSF